VLNLIFCKIVKKLLIISLFISVCSFGQEIYSTQVKNSFSAGEAAFQSGEMNLAKKQFNAALAANPNVHEALTNLAIINYLEGDFSAGIDHASKAIAISPKNINAHFYLGRCYFKLQDYTSAAKSFEEAKSLGLNTTDLYNLIGWTSYSLNKMDESVSAFDKAITLDEGNVDAYKGRSKANAAQGNYDAAANDLNTLLKINPDDQKIYLNIAELYYASGKVDEGDALIEERLGVADATEKVNLLIVQGNHHFDKQELELAKALFDKAYALDDKNGMVMVNQSAVLIAQNKYAEAVVKIDEALAVDAEIKEAYFNRGIANEMLRNVEEACNDWETAFILGSQQAEKYLNSAICNE
jgi:tetratricopeptide (TPR) repeat protein